MQEYTWSSNHHHPPPVYQKAPPPYQDARSYRPNSHQPKLSPQLFVQGQPRHSPGQQEAVNNWSSSQAVSSNNTCVPFQQNQYDGPTKTSFPQQPFTGQQQHCMFSNGAVHYTQLNTPSSLYISTQQKYRNTGPVNSNVGPDQAPKYWTQLSDDGRFRLMSVANDSTRSLSSCISDDSRSCFITNQQQPQAPRPANLHHQLHQHSGQTPGQPLYQVQGGTAVCYAPHSSGVLPPAGPERNKPPPFSNFQQSPTQLNLDQSQNDQSSAEHTNSKACTINQSSKNQLNQFKCYMNSKLYQLICTDNGKQSFGNSLATNTQPSGDEVQNPSGRLLGNGTDGTVHNLHSRLFFSEPNLQSVVEPPSKRVNYGVTQRDYWNKLPTRNTNVSKDKNGLALRSALPDTHRMGGMEQNHAEKRQIRTGPSEVIYSSDPADCLEAVYALQKAFQQVNKAVAIVPPISQQPSNTEDMHDVSPHILKSPPLKIDAVWSLAKVCDLQNPFSKVNDSLTVEEDDKIRPENKTVDAIAGVTQPTEACSASPSAGRQNNVLQRNCDSSDGVFELSSVPVVKYTLEELMKFVKSLEVTDLSAGYTEKPESVFQQILNLYWNGNEENLVKRFNVLDQVIRHSLVEGVKNDQSVVFESIAHGNLKKVSNCAVINDQICSSPVEFRSSWLNVDGQPADIDKVLSEPLWGDITVNKGTSENVLVSTDSSAVSSSQVPEVTSLSAEEKSVKPNSGSPEDVFTSSGENAGNGRGETATQNKSHSDADIPGVASVCHGPSQQETVKKQSDILQHQNHVNTEPTDTSPSTDMCSDPLKDEKTTETLSQEHLKNKQQIHFTTLEVLKSASLCVQPANVDSEQPHDNLPVSDSLPVCRKDKLLPSVSAGSDGEKHCDGSFLKEPHSTSTDTMQIEDISDDENAGHEEVLTNFTNTMQVEDISDDENAGHEEVLTNFTNMMQVEDISDDENAGHEEVLTNFTNTMQIEDISDDESDDSLVMGITVLSSEDALNFFQQFEKEPQSKTETVSMRSDVETPELESHLPHQPNTKRNKAKICSRCGTNSVVKFSSTYVPDNDRELFCSLCWDTAPSLVLEMKPCSPKRDAADVLHSLTKAEEPGQNQCPPILEPESFTAPAVAHNAVEEPREKHEGKSVLKPVLYKISEIQSTVELELTKDKHSKTDSVPRPQLLTQSNTSCLSKSAFLKCKLKSGSVVTGSDDVMLCAPEIVLEKKQPHKKNQGDCLLTAVPAVSRRQNCAGVKNIIEPRQDPSLQAETDRTSQNSPETVRGIMSGYSTPPMTLDMCAESRPVRKIKTNQTKKVSFALYGSKSECQCDERGPNCSSPTSSIVSNACRDSLGNASKNTRQCFPQGRRFSAPPSLTLSTAGKDSDALSARQKVHNQWSSTFISKVTRTSPKSPQKKKTERPREVLKSNMVALKEHLKQRAMILSDQELQNH